MPHIANIMAFILLLGSFLPQSDVAQLRKLPQLFNHYEQHVQLAAAQGDSLSFAHYLCIHFIHPDQHSHGDNSHQDLPMQHFGMGIIAALPVSPALPTLVTTVVSVSTPNFPAQAYLSRGFTGMVLRPPIA
jgi:hypothetical protein